MTTYRVNADRLRAATVDVDKVLARDVGRGFVTVTADEMDALGREIARLARVRNMTDVVEFA